MTAALLVEATVKVSLILLVGLAGVRCLRRRSAAARHWVLSIAVLCALMAPALGVVGPSWVVPVFPPAEALWSGAMDARVAGEAGAPPPSGAAGSGGPGAATTAGAPAGSSAEPDSGLSPGVMSVWVVWVVGAGAGVGAAVLLVGCLRLAWLRRRATAVTSGPWRELADEIGSRLGVSRPVRLLQSRHATLLATWGLVRPKVMLPAGAGSWPEARMRVVLAHELAHVRRGDWAWQLCAELLRAALWFNPLTWIVLHRQRRDSELACDDEVLGLGMAGTAYAAQLLDLVKVLRSRRPRWSAGVAMAGPSGFERRIAAMMNPSVVRRPLAPGARLAIVSAAVCLTVPLAILAQSGSARFSGTVVDSTGQPWAGAYITLVPASGEGSPGAGLTGSVVGPETQLRLVGTTIAGVGSESTEHGITVSADGNRITFTKINNGGPSVRSDDSGRFDMQDVPPGDYRLRVELWGFVPIDEAVTLQAGRREHRDFVLALGPLAETITVTTAEPDPALAALDDTTESLRRSLRRSHDGRLQLPARVRGVALPAYPDELRGSGAEGQVILEGLVTADGSLRVLTVQTPVDPDTLTAVQPDLARAAIAIVGRWGYEPAVLNDVPVDMPIRVTVNFVDES